MDNISLKGIGYGLLFAYILPMAGIKALLYVLANIGIQNIFGGLATLLVVYLLVFAPLASGYLGAKNSESLPLLNGMAATILGVLFVILAGELNGLYIFIIFIIVSLTLGYIGSNRFVKHG